MPQKNGPLLPMDIERGKRLADARYANRLAQSEVAQMLGVSVNTVSRWETGNITAREPVLRRLEDLYGVPRGTFTAINAAQAEQAHPEARPQAPSNAAGALYWAVGEMMETCTRISREAARLTSALPAASADPVSAAAARDLLEASQRQQAPAVPHRPAKAKGRK